jgi:hypothetical protein
MVSVLTTGPKGRGFKPGQGILKAIKYAAQLPSEVKPEAPCYNILRHVKVPLKYQRY